MGRAERDRTGCCCRSNGMRQRVQQRWLTRSGAVSSAPPACEGSGSGQLLHPGLDQLLVSHAGAPGLLPEPLRFRGDDGPGRTRVCVGGTWRWGCSSLVAGVGGAFLIPSCGIKMRLGQYSKMAARRGGANSLHVAFMSLVHLIQPVYHLNASSCC